MNSVSPRQFASNIAGFWGPITSTVDWCENNYEHSHLIAEFFNSLSSMCMISIGLLGVLFHYSWIERRFILGFLSIVVVGLGSIAFHGTLLFELQMLDEVPMLFTALIITYIQFEMNRPPSFYEKRPKSIWLPIFLTLHGIIATFLTMSPILLGPTYASPVAQFFAFHLCFKSLELYNLSKVFQLWYDEKDPTLKKQLHERGMKFYVAGAVLWLIDWFGCESIWEGVNSYRMTHPVSIIFPTFDGVQFAIKSTSFILPNPQLHGASVGLYLMMLALVYKRCQVNNTRVRLVYYFGLIPHLTKSSK